MVCDTTQHKTYVQPDITQFSRYDYLRTQKTDLEANKRRNAPFSLSVEGESF